ncbi:N-acetyltransferase family protein [Virgibacillus flavescens]|uniref:GNAT family N-acetyltransferase n=1 Tax=Virgibacillus flavescens TaxID=1611422 RepID=UPI003D331C29
MKYTTREMNVEYIPHVQHVAKASWKHTYKGLIPIDIQERFIASAYSSEMMKKRLETSYLFLAEVNGEVVGFANFSPIKKDGSAELGAIYLLPAFQGAGIGTKLLKLGISKLKGAAEIYINVEKENKSGRTFYEAKGFETVSEFDDDFDGHILQTVRMVLKRDSGTVLVSR